MHFKVLRLELDYRKTHRHHQLQTEPLNRNLTNVSFNYESSQATREVSMERLSGKEPATET